MEKWFFLNIRKVKNSVKGCEFSLWSACFEGFIILTGMILFSFNSAFGQGSLLEKNISIPKQKTTLYEALNQISQNADCLFIYDSETLENNKRVKLHADQQPLHKVLDELLSNPGLAYRVLGKHILIYRTNRNELPVKIIQPPMPGLDIVKNIEIRGYIYDKESKAAIPFATIGVAEKNIGTVTNIDGFFLLKIPDSLRETSLFVSHLGYLSQQIPVQLITDRPVDIYLHRRVYSIQEVIIRYMDPNLIIEEAMEHRGKNYPGNPVYLTTFYREGVQKNNKYMSYSEAVFKVYKSPFESGQSDQVKLLKSRKIQDSSSGDTVILKLKAGVQSALQLDVVKFIPGFLDQSPPIEYTYRYTNLVSYHNQDAYAISFTQNPGIQRALYSGTLYIGKDNFPILGADFEINPAYLNLAEEFLILKKSRKLIVKLQKISYTVSYIPFHGKYYLHHVRCDMQLTTRKKHHFVTNQFHTYLELATCNIDTSKVEKFPKQETLKPNVIFSDQPYDSDPAFWGNFNTITPEIKLNEALQGIIGKIEWMNDLTP